MKKIISTLLVLIVVFAFAGCSNSNNSSDPSSSANSSDVLTSNSNNDAEKYATFKDTCRDCNGNINDGISNLQNNFDSAFYETNASSYIQYMNYGKDLLLGVEYIFSGNNDDIESSLSDYLHMSDIKYTIDKNTATINCVNADNENAKIVVKYDGESCAEIMYYVNDNVKEALSFITNNDYSAAFYYDDLITTVDVTYTNGDTYFAFDDENKSEKISLMDNMEALKDPSFITNNRSYIALVGGTFVNNTGAK